MPLRRLNRLKMSNRQERCTAHEIGGRQTRGSGRMYHQKSDVVSSLVRIEVKVTTKKQYILKQSEMEKIRREAIRTNRIPAFGVSFDGKTRPEWILIPFDDFLEKFTLQT